MPIRRPAHTVDRVLKQTRKERNITTMDTINEADFTRLLLLVAPIARTDPAIGSAPCPRWFGLRRAGLVSTLGDVARIWTNFPGPCPTCGANSVLTGVRGNPLTGTGKTALWFCPRCDAPFETGIVEPLTRFMRRIAADRQSSNSD